MEKPLRIKAGKHVIYGRLNGSLRKPLCIIVHGLPGNLQESFYHRAAEWFTENGYAAFRFNCYDWQKGARQLIGSTLRTQADDLDTVVRYFRKRGVKKLVVVGHSYGGPTILLSRKQDFDAVTLWDPSYRLSFTKKNYGSPGGIYIKQLDGYFMKHWGINVVLGRAMAEEADHLRWNDLTKNFYVPIKMIAAGKGVLVPGIKQYFKHAHDPKEMNILKDATHYFDDRDGLQEKVFQLSKKWFDRYV